MNLSGSPVDFILAFLGGVAVSLSPCIYPLIPVSIGAIGAQPGESRLKAFSLSLVYTSGIALVYSCLGLIAVLTGRVFGEISSNPFTYIIAGLIIIFFGISMFEIIRIPSSRVFRLPHSDKKGYLGIFLLGLSSGLVVGPCVTPVLGSILVYLAASKNILYAAALLMSFAYGMGLILVLAGTFSGLLAALPKSGAWLVYVKKASALILVLAGSYFLFIGIRAFI
ncbi:MAG: cytochrome c biogenesis protein CcdA [Candidatus Omnitrophota bacterium]|jgi:thiol:disulfide interchange protein DsbD